MISAGTKKRLAPYIGLVRSFLKDHTPAREFQEQYIKLRRKILDSYDLWDNKAVVSILEEIFLSAEAYSDDPEVYCSIDENQLRKEVQEQFDKLNKLLNE